MLLGFESGKSVKDISFLKLTSTIQMHQIIFHDSLSVLYYFHRILNNNRTSTLIGLQLTFFLQVKLLIFLRLIKCKILNTTNADNIS